MNAQANKQLMQEVFSGLEQGSGQPFVEAMADDFCWHLIGTTAWSGTYQGKRAVRERLLTPLLKQFADRYTNTALRFIAEDDYVVVECRGSVTTKTNKPYNNTYCWVCRIADGKLKALTEYCDTALITTALGDPEQPAV